MTVKINYLSKTISKFSSNLVLFVNEKFNISSLKKNLSDLELYIEPKELEYQDLEKEKK